MGTQNSQKAFYAWAVVFDWMIGKMEKWKIVSLSKFVNHILMLWILLERHNLLEPVLQKLATLEGYTSADELRRSLSGRFSRAKVTTDDNSDTNAARLSGKV